LSENRFNALGIHGHQKRHVRPVSGISIYVTTDYGGSDRMTVKELIKNLNAYPQDAIVEIGMYGNIQPVGMFTHWASDRNGFESVMITHPPLDRQCVEIYENHKKLA